MTFTHFCDLDTDLNNGVLPPSTYTAVVLLPTSAVGLSLFMISIPRKSTVSCADPEADNSVIVNFAKIDLFINGLAGNAAVIAFSIKA